MKEIIATQILDYLNQLQFVESSHDANLLKMKLECLKIAAEISNKIAHSEAAPPKQLPDFNL